MERVLVAVASALITGAIFLGAFSLLQFVWPLMTALAAHPHLAHVLLPVFFGVWAIWFAILAIIFRSRHDMVRSLSAILGAVNMASFLGVNSLLPFLGPLVVKHNLAPAAGAVIFAGPLAILGVVNVVLLRRIAILARPKP